MSHEKPREYKRFTAAQRMEHIILIVSFSTLALTGLPQKYASHDWAKTMIDVLGGIESIRIVHRFMAATLIAASIYHIIALGYKIVVLGHRLDMAPTLGDATNVWDYVRYNLGWRAAPPKFPRYNFGEKAEYLALVWGTLVMVLTGFMLWNPIATTNLLPGAWIPAARAAHGAEAVLAVASIITWHMYNVHFKHFNRAMFTGKLTHHQMEEEHAGELEELEKGRARREVPADLIRARRRVYWPPALIIVVVLLAALLWFTTFESSAITTVPRLSAAGEKVDINPDVGSAERGAALWTETRCDSCHGPDGHGIADRANFSIAGTQLSFDAFVMSLRRGPAEMPAYNSQELSGEQLADLWVWLRSLED
jgi:cytochrome b subunit of formate dehydrogenase